MSRAARGVYAALVAATVAAFFVTQHLKSTTPLLNGSPHPSPQAFSPGQRGCVGRFARTRFSFYLQHRADDVIVQVIDQGGNVVRTIASGRHMRIGVRHPDGDFVWNGRADSGRIVADGDYRFRVTLIHQNRAIVIKSPVTVQLGAPRPVVQRVSAAGASPALLPAPGGARIFYSGTRGHIATVQLYRTDLPGGAVRLVKAFRSAHSPAVWDGLIQGHPAPAGIYLAGLLVADRACNTGRFPPVIPPVPGTTAGAGITVRYLAALPPLDPVRGGTAAHVFVDSRRRAYSWALRKVTGARVLASGHGSGPALAVPLPRGSGLYSLSVVAGADRTSVPIVASGAPAPILVVLPALTWQGLNPSDATGDGLPVTLDSGGPVSLIRPFGAGGLPAGVQDEAALLAFLDAAHLRYALTTDLGLLDGAGPGLFGHSGVVFAGPERWAPASLTGPLIRYLRQGGRVLTLGPDSFRRTVTVAGGTARDPGQPAVADALGATTGPFVAHAQGVILALSDGLGLFAGTGQALPSFSAFQPVTGTVPPAGKVLSAMGPSPGSAAIAGWRLGAGIVIESGLSGFGAGLARDVNAQELTRRLWTILSH